MKRLLVVSTTGMGDSLWATPGLRALKKSFPETAIDFLVDQRWRPLFDSNPHIDRILEYKKQWYRQLALWPQLWRETYDHVLLFHANNDLRRILWGVRCGRVWTHQPFAWVADGGRIVVPRPTHSIRRRLALIEHVGATADGGALELHLTGRDHQTADRFLEEHGLTDNNFIYLNVGASYAHKRWPAERWADLGLKIVKNLSLKIVLGGGPEEVELVDSIRARLGNEAVSVYCRPVRDNAALIARARAMVTCDSGPMHLALAQNVPVVALFGVTDPRESGPYDLSAQACRIIVSPANFVVHAQVPRTDADPFAHIDIATVWENTQELTRSPRPQNPAT
jgi:ADP-heptose:LPS heptosyltransferase